MKREADLDPPPRKLLRCILPTGGSWGGPVKMNTLFLPYSE